MGHQELPYRLEELLTSFYRVEKVQQINYVQYIPSKPDAQWSIQAELALRKHNPKILVSLFSRELWCFSINDEETPSLELDLVGCPPSPEKKGYFTCNISKPNLPTAYAVFLKALRRTIHINLCLESHQLLVPFGNSCLMRSNEQASTVIHFEPQIFENGDLCVSICSKRMDLRSLDQKKINEDFLKTNAIYLAPSGIRAYLASPDIKKCLTTPPKSASVLLITLLVSHGIDLTKKKDLTWVKVTPNLDHLNGYTPSIAGYLDPPKATKTAIWPLELCFSQATVDIPTSKLSTQRPVPDLQETFDIIDDFIELKLTSAVKTPGHTSTGATFGTITGNNALSTGGTCGDHFQAFHKQPQSAYSNTTGQFNSQLGVKHSPGASGAALTPGNIKSAPQSAENFSNVFLTTPSINENVETTNDIQLPLGTPRKLEGDLWREKKQIDIADELGIRNTTVAEPEVPEADLEKDDADLDAELFGDENGDESEEQEQLGGGDSVHQVKDITDEMFDIADDSDSSRDKSAQPKEPSPFNIRESPFKRKYMDIPLEEMTLPSTPLYTDPGAPLPVETPKDRRKSVFAPLNFNPIIESNVDNKYKNGGKFSFNGDKVEEPLKFDVSTANVSSSEEEDSNTSAEEFDDMLTNNSQARSAEAIIPITSFPSDVQTRAMTEIVQPDIFREVSPLPLFDSGLNGEKISREGNLDNWKFSKSMSANYLSPPKAYSNPCNGKLGPQNASASDSEEMLKLGILEPPNKSPNFNIFPGNDNNLEAIESGDKSSTNAASEENTPTPESSNSLPFLLRHMPLFSIPEKFLHKNPCLSAKDDLAGVLDVLCEQIVFDQEALQNICYNTVAYNSFIGCGDGVIKSTFKSIFSGFQRIHGGELIEEMNILQQPAVYVKKNDEVIKIKGDSEPFSQYLHLKPFKGIKSFKGLFLTTTLKNECLDFLATISQIYSNQELGFCELVKVTSADTPGLIYLVNLEENTLSLLAAQIVSFCSTNTLNTMPVPLVIFLPVLSTSLSDVVSMTLKFQSIKNEVISKLPNVKLCLKLIPLDFIKNPLTSVEEYYDFCVGIYNGLPPKSVKFTSIADEVPKKIDFRTFQKTSGQMSHFDSYVHLAYARSVDRNWICAAWSNSTGSENGVKTWYIGNLKSAFEDACNQMWRITLKFASNKYGRICLILTRTDSVLPDDELMNWRRLSSGSRNLHLAVVCVGDNSKFSLYDEDRMYPSFKPIIEDERLSNRIDLSNLDNYEIIDIKGEVHSIVLRNPLQLANSQHRCAINTGALVRFKASGSKEVLDKFEVNLLNCPHADSTKLLKLILLEFRNLAALNSWFGVSKFKESYIPWHVLAVKKMLNTVVHLKVTDFT